jgi:hypothetical protein
MGQRKLVIKMLDDGAIVNNPEKKDPKMVEFFSKYHKNVLNLTQGIAQEVDKTNLNLLINTMKDEFNISSN